MSIRWCFVHGLVLIGLALLAVGQNPPAPNTGEESGATRSVPAAALSGMVGVDMQSGDENSEDIASDSRDARGPRSFISLRLGDGAIELPERWRQRRRGLR